MKSGNVHNLSSLKSFIQIYYTCKLCFLSWFFQLYGPYYNTNPKAPLFIADLSKLFFNSASSFYILSLISFSLITFILLKPFNTVLKISEAFISLIFSALLYQSHRLGHSLNIFLLCSFFISFLRENNKCQLIKTMINLSLSIYFCAGVWKLIGLTSGIFQGKGVNTFKGLLLEHGARKALLMGYNNPVLHWINLMPDFFHIFIALLVIAFQLFMIVPIIKNVHSQKLGVSLILFHLGGQILLDINFIETQILIGVLFFLGLPLIEENVEKSDF